ncbi:MAG TPA: hypothetical protein VFB26_05360 [Gaiellaceae bacterium]|nr:hypothetical protein [Gaiellaceae bacterium]
MPLYLSAADADELLPADVAIAVVEAACARLAAGSVTAQARRAAGAGGIRTATGSVVDAELDAAATESEADSEAGRARVACVLAGDGRATVAIVEGGLSRLAAGAASGAAARRLARPGAASVGLIGCGRQARLQLAALRAALPGLRDARAWCPTEARLRAFCDETGATPASSAQEAARCDVVVTATTSRDPVLRGDWLRPGALVCATGANARDHRELDVAVLRQAAFVCCETLEQARADAGDLVETVAAGVLDWLEVHELADVVAGELVGRSRNDDVVVFKASGAPHWSAALGAELVGRARDRGLGTAL